ncbi:hypothetical protein LTR35_018032 [Friedmanniomyces endolithicus]|nr:hypothetical protein LTR35_018032 [Friedmanniomyces endolithicus]
MAETFLTNSAEDGSGARQRSKIVDVCNLVVGLQQGQFQLVSQMETLVLAQKQLLLAQEQLEQRVATLVEELREQRQAACPGTGMAGPALRFDAGSRLTGTFELLEMLLRELPNETTLVFQRVNNQFKSVVAESCLLQHKLFFETGPLALSPVDLILNPVLTKKSVLCCLPIYGSDKNTRLAYCYRAGRQRLYCQSMTISIEGNTGQAWINLDLAKGGFDTVFLHLPQREGVGSWKRMYITQPSCDVMLRATIKEGKTRTCHTMRSGGIFTRMSLDESG